MGVNNDKAAYDYGAQNNGQIQKVTYYSSPGVEDPTKSQNFQYDAWSRLKQASTTDLTTDGTWQLQWDYDRFGNRRNQTLIGGFRACLAKSLACSCCVRVGNEFPPDRTRATHQG